MRTVPVPYSKTCDTFRAADCAATGTGLRRKTFIGFDVSRPVPAGLVSELRFQHRPTRVENGLRHFRFCEPRRADVADYDGVIFPSKTGAPLVKMVPPRVGDLGVDGANAALVASPLRDGKSGFVLAIVLQGRNARAITARRKRLKAEVYPDLAVASWQRVGNLALKTDVPAATRILHEAASFEFPVNVAGLPEVELPFQVRDVRVLDANGAGDKRYPPECALRSKAGPEARAALVQIAGRNELAADRLHRIGMQAKIGSGTSAELHKIEGRWPADGKASLTAALSFPMGGNAIVPHLVARDGVAVQVLPRRCVLDAIFECEHHAPICNWSEGEMPKNKAV